jgi:hypothetical protein
MDKFYTFQSRVRQWFQQACEVFKRILRGTGARSKLPSSETVASVLWRANIERQNRTKP